MASGVLAMAKRRGYAKGLREGLREVTEAFWRLCLDVVEKHHPELLEDVAPVIQACPDLESLTSWPLLASERDSAGLLEAIASKPLSL